MGNGRSGEEIALKQADARSLQRHQFGLSLDPLRDHGNVVRTRQLCDAGDDRLLDGRGLNATHQIHIDLDQVRQQIGEQDKPGMACTEIVNGGDESHLT